MCRLIGSKTESLFFCTLKTTFIFYSLTACTAATFRLVNTTFFPAQSPLAHHTHKKKASEITFAAPALGHSLAMVCVCVPTFNMIFSGCWIDHHSGGCSSLKRTCWCQSERQPPGSWALWMRFWCNAANYGASIHNIGRRLSQCHSLGCALVRAHPSSTVQKSSSKKNVRLEWRWQLSQCFESKPCVVFEFI